jgi:hypothetical protein
LDKLEELGIVAIKKFPLAVDIGDEAKEVEDASSGGRMIMNMQAAELKIEAKVDNLMRKFNILVIVLAFCLGCVVMYVGNQKVFNT